MLHTTVIPPQNLEVHIGKLRFVDKNGNKIIDKGDQITSIDGSAVLSVASPEVRAFMKKYGANKLGHKGWKLLSPLVNYFVNMGHARSASLYGDSKGVDRSLNVAASYSQQGGFRFDDKSEREIVKMLFYRRMAIATDFHNHGNWDLLHHSLLTTEKIVDGYLNIIDPSPIRREIAVFRQNALASCMVEAGAHSNQGNVDATEDAIALAFDFETPQHQVNQVTAGLMAETSRRAAVDQILKEADPLSRVVGNLDQVEKLLREAEKYAKEVSKKFAQEVDQKTEQIRYQIRD